MDIGASSGEILKEFKDLADLANIKVNELGLEYNRDYVNMARKNNINMLQGSINDIEDEETYDLVILSHVLEHFFDPREELKSIKNVIDKNSLIYIEVPGIKDLQNKFVYDCDYLKYRVGAHNFDFSLCSLQNLLNKMNFELIKGDEKIMSIFKLSKSHNNNYNITYCYKKEMEYLKDIEVNRGKYANSIKNPKKFPLKLIRKIKGIINKFVGGPNE